MARPGGDPYDVAGGDSYTPIVDDHDVKIQIDGQASQGLTHVAGPGDQQRRRHFQVDAVLLRFALVFDGDGKRGGLPSFRLGDGVPDQFQAATRRHRRDADKHSPAAD